MLDLRQKMRLAAATQRPLRLSPDDCALVGRIMDDNRVQHIQAGGAGDLLLRRQVEEAMRMPKAVGWGAVALSCACFAAVAALLLT